MLHILVNSANLGWIFPVYLTSSGTVSWVKESSLRSEQIRSVSYSGLVYSGNEISIYCCWELPAKNAPALPSHCETCWILDRYPEEKFRHEFWKNRKIVIFCNSKSIGDRGEKNGTLVPSSSGHLYMGKYIFLLKFLKIISIKYCTTIRE